MGRTGTSGMASMRSKVTTFTDRFRLGPHYAIDRFGIKVVILLVTGVLVMTMTGYGAWRAGQAVLGAQSLYTGEFTTSRTGATGKVDAVYRNADSTRAMVVMTFDEDSSMSSRAEDYQAFVMGMDDGSATEVAAPMAGQIYVFGETKSMGVLLEAPEGLPQQMINVTMRAKKELMPAVERPGGSAGGSFAEFDQWRVVINPGGSSAIKLSALGSEKTPAPEDVYSDVVLWQKERAQRRTLDGLLAKMKTQLDAIESLHEQMETTTVQLGADKNVRLMPPSLPSVISGDTITGMSSTELRKELGRTSADKIEGIGNKTERARQLDTYSDGYLPNTYVLHSKELMPGGMDFDWRSRGVSDGYFEGLNTGSPSIAEYLSKVQADGGRGGFHSRELKWPLSNGKTTEDIRSLDVGAKPLLDLRNKTISAYDEYYRLKQEYQTYALVQMLVLESELNGVASTATISGGSEAVSIRS